ncbi:MAG: DUF2834 domain-containing protein [Thainema sp.]
MVRKFGFGLLWIGFVSYAVLLAPPNQPDTFDLILRLSTGDWQGINPLIIALFNLMGIWPMIYACLLLADGRNQKLWAWPFLIGSFGLGAFTLLPYLALRQPNPMFTGSKNWLIRILDARITGVLLAVGAIALLIYGFSQGNWSDYIYEWQTRRFVHVMSLDFVLLCLIFPALLGDDMARRGWQNQPVIFWLVALLPLIGPLVYLIIRPSLQPTNPENAAPSRSKSASVA